jgi:cytochrome P450
MPIAAGRSALMIEIAEWLDLDPIAKRDSLREIAKTERVARTFEGVWVLHWDDVRALLRDKRFEGVGLTMFDLLGITDGPLRRWYGGLMFTNEGLAHNRLRSLVQQAFVPRSIEALRAVTSAIADDLLRPIAVGGQGDLLDLATHAPIRAIAKLVGVSDDDLAEFTRHSQVLSRVFGYMTPDEIEAATHSIQELLAFTRGLLDARRADPRDDLITRLFQAEVDGERLTDAEVADMVVNIVVGAHDTSTGQIACTLFTLLEHPEMLAELRAEPALVPVAVEETMRYASSIGAIPRVAIEAVDHNGLRFDVGTLVLLCTDTANHDPAGYAEPGRFLPSRFDADEVHRLMTFGAGPHYCLGAAFARMVVQESVAAALRLPEPLRLAEPAARLPWKSVLATYPARLPITCGA